MTSYLQTCLKELRKAVRKLPREQRTAVLDAYQDGLELSFRENFDLEYSGKTWRCPAHTINPPTSQFYEKGYYTGSQFGELEVRNARQVILEALEQERARASRKSLLRMLSDLIKNGIRKKEK